MSSPSPRFFLTPALGVRTPAPWLDSQLDPLTHYVIVRADLPLGLLAAQVTHAAGESSPGNLPENTHAVVLGVGPERLEDVRSRLARHRVPHRVIVEDAAPWTGQI